MCSCIPSCTYVPCVRLRAATAKLCLLLKNKTAGGMGRMGGMMVRGLFSLYLVLWPQDIQRR